MTVTCIKPGSSWQRRGAILEIKQIAQEGFALALVLTPIAAILKVVIVIPVMGRTIGLGRGGATIIDGRTFDKFV